MLPAGALFVLLLAAISWLALSEPAQADPNELRIDPSAVEVSPGDTVTVSLSADPPATTLTVWGVDVVFDPDVVTTDTFRCDVLDPLPNSLTIGTCPVTASVEGGTPDTVKVLGAMIFTETEDGHEAGDGLDEETVLADITFEVVGEPGQCSTLSLNRINHIDVDAEETNPLLFDGRICIEQDAPPSGTSVPHTPTPRTAGPTPTGDPQVTPIDINPETEPGSTNGGGRPDAGGGQGSPGSSPDDGDASPRSPRTGDGTSTPDAGNGDGNGDDDDDGGSGIVVWLLIGLGALVVVAAVAWAVVRNFSRGPGPPEEPPSA